MHNLNAWEIDRLLAEHPLGADAIKWVYLAHSERCSLNLVQGRALNMPHIHDHHDEVLIIIEGHGSFRLGESILPLSKGGIFFIPAGTVHTPIIEGYEAALSVYTPWFDPDNPDRRFVDT